MKLRISASLLLMLMLLTACVAMAQAPTPFSADMKMTGGRMGTTTGKMYFAGQKFRIDMNNAGRENSIITDLPSKRAYMIMPQQHMYMEMDTTQGGQRPQWKPYNAANPCENEAGVTCKKVGAELVDGRMCDKWVFTGRSGSERTVWIDQRSHIPIKTVNGEITWELSNIKEGPQPANLFELPAGYQKMDMGGMMRGMKPPSE